MSRDQGALILGVGGAEFLRIDANGLVTVRGKVVGEGKDILEGLREFLRLASQARESADHDVRNLIAQARHALSALTFDVHEQTRRIVASHLEKALAPFPDPLPIDGRPS